MNRLNIFISEVRKSICFTPFGICPFITTLSPYSIFTFKKPEDPAFN